jgi:hypothetical protein
MNKNQRAERNEFNKQFDELLDKTIRPTMKKLLYEINGYGHPHEVIESSTHCDCYKINHKKGNKYMQITFMSDDIQHCVLVSTEHCTGNDSATVNALYKIKEITPELIEIIITKGLNTFL